MKSRKDRKKEFMDAEDPRFEDPLMRISCSFLWSFAAL